MVQPTVFMESLVCQRKKLILTLVKQGQIFPWVIKWWNFCLNQNLVRKCFNGKEIFMFRTDNKNGNFRTKFWLRSIPSGFHVTDSRAVSLEGKVYNFSVDSNDIDKPEILNIHMYLIFKSSIKV